MMFGFAAILLIILLLIALLKNLLLVNAYSWNDGPYIIAGRDACRSVKICWITSSKKNSVIKWGTSKNNLSMQAVSKKERFHSVVLKELEPGTTYFYRVEEDLPYGRHGSVLQFTLCRNIAEKSLNILIMGDLQPRDCATLRANRITANRAAEENPDFILQTGDTVQIGTDKRSWHFLMSTIPRAISEIPFLPSIGNHERYVLHSSRNFRTAFPMEYANSIGAYYSVDINSAHIIFLDPFDGGFAGMKSWFSKRQKRWLTEDLEKAVLNKSEWIFVVLHQPVFTSGEYKNDVAMRNWLIPVLARYDVDAVFFGHSHMYEHWIYRYGWNGYVLDRKDTPARNPVHFFCIGSSGARLESSFNIFAHPPFCLKKETWYNCRTGNKKTMTHFQYPWNKHVSYGEDTKHLRYYHYPFDKDGNETSDPERCYSTSNNWFGFRYGEIAFHYAKIMISGSTCRISVHYPDGSLIKGFNGNLPQEFVLEKKKRACNIIL